jgi:hypothetical protein
VRTTKCLNASPCPLKNQRAHCGSWARAVSRRWQATGGRGNDPRRDTRGTGSTCVGLGAGAITPLPPAHRADAVRCAGSRVRVGGFARTMTALPNRDLTPADGRASRRGNGLRPEQWCDSWLPGSRDPRQGREVPPLARPGCWTPVDLLPIIGRGSIYHPEGAVPSSQPAKHEATDAPLTD